MIGKNPYAEIINMMRTHGAKNNPPTIQLAEVTSPPKDLIIRVGNIEITKENILIADYLLQGYSRTFEAAGKINMENGTIKFTDTECGKTGQADKHAHSIASIEIDTSTGFSIKSDFKAAGDDKDNSKCFKFTDTLKVGDIVAVMPTYDMQMYIILARVVKPDE